MTTFTNPHERIEQLQSRLDADVGVIQRLRAELADSRQWMAEMRATGAQHADRIRALEADLADSRLIAREQEDAHVAANMRYSAELALRQTAEGYAARNALRVIAVEAVADQRMDKIAVLAAALTKVHGMIAEYWGPCMASVESLATIRDAIGPDAAKWGPKLPQTETACTCDSTLVTATSNHQPHCPRYVAETP